MGQDGMPLFYRRNGHVHALYQPSMFNDSSFASSIVSLRQKLIDAIEKGTVDWVKEINAHPLDKGELSFELDRLAHHQEERYAQLTQTPPVTFGEFPVSRRHSMTFEGPLEDLQREIHKSKAPTFVDLLKETYKTLADNVATLSGEAQAKL